MKAIIQEIARETTVRDREGKVLTSFTGKLSTLLLRVVIAGLFTMAISGILFFIIAMITGDVDTANANFGIYG
mgnify:CR=1 FL=1|tara:strand:+ start:302 stop:520 length:219 start_codon:yes stop_codon:yes gene_type:complete